MTTTITLPNGNAVRCAPITSAKLLASTTADIEEAAASVEGARLVGVECFDCRTVAVYAHVLAGFDVANVEADMLDAMLLVTPAETRVLFDVRDRAERAAVDPEATP